MTQKKKLEDILVDPSSAFSHPHEVLGLDYFTKEEKIEILKRWEQDARELDVAEEEGMTGGTASQLDEIINAIDKLDPEYHQSGSSAPNKQGNIAD